jgi:hypothetical protein
MENSCLSAHRLSNTDIDSRCKHSRRHALELRFPDVNEFRIVVTRIFYFFCSQGSLFVKIFKNAKFIFYFMYPHIIRGLPWLWVRYWRSFVWLANVCVVTWTASAVGCWSGKPATASIIIIFVERPFFLAAE